MYMYVSFFFSPEAINHAAEAWGIRCMRYEIKDIMLPTKVKEAMQMQVGGLVHICSLSLLETGEPASGCLDE